MMAPIENAQDLVLCYYQSPILFPLSLIIFFFSRRPDLLPPLAGIKLKKQMRRWTFIIGHGSGQGNAYATTFCEEVHQGCALKNAGKKPRNQLFRILGAIYAACAPLCTILQDAKDLRATLHCCSELGKLSQQGASSRQLPSFSPQMKLISIRMNYCHSTVSPQKQ